MATSEANETDEKSPRSFWRGRRRPEEASMMEFLFTLRVFGTPAKVLLMIRLHLTVLRAVSISNLLDYVPGSKVID